MFPRQGVEPANSQVNGEPLPCLAILVFESTVQVASTSVMIFLGFWAVFRTVSDRQSTDDALQCLTNFKEMTDDIRGWGVGGGGGGQSTQKGDYKLFLVGHDETVCEFSAKMPFFFWKQRRDRLLTCKRCKRKNDFLVNRRLFSWCVRTC